ncbi:MAG TPA: DUF2760 domain-containing protein [Candidatus Binatia bacterium]|jgi:hypothetical protein
MTATRAAAPAVNWILIAVIALAGAGAGALALAALLPGGQSGLRDALVANPLAAGGALAAPFVAAWIGALAARGSARPAAEVPPTGRGAKPVPPVTAGADALQLLALLQQEGRFVDFIEENLAPYSDEQVGTAVRSIHDGCRSALRERITLRPVLAAAEGATVTVERGFDPAAVRVIGNVRGEPPYRGVLRHPGWRSESVALPERTGDADATIIAPAEVEVL